MGLFGGDCKETCHNLSAGKDNICDICFKDNGEALDASVEWERMNSAWICLATGGLQFMQATTCCCADSNSRELAVARSRNRSMSELLFRVMARLTGDSKGGSCVLPEHEGAELGGHYETFRFAPVLKVLCQYASPEVAAFLKGSPSGAGKGPDNLAQVMAHLNPGASISLPDCLDMKGCQLVIPHAAVLDGTEGEAPEDEDNLQEDASIETFPKPNN